MNLLSIIPWYIRALLIAAVFVAGTIIGAVEMRKWDNTRYERLLVQAQSFQDQVASAGAASARHSQTVIARQQQVNAQSESDYAKSLDVIRAYYNRRLRASASTRAGRGAVPAVSFPTGGAHEVASDTQLASACAATTEQLIALQTWIVEQKRAETQ